MERHIGLVIAVLLALAAAALWLGLKVYGSGSPFMGGY